MRQGRGQSGQGGRAGRGGGGGGGQGAGRGAAQGGRARCRRAKGTTHLHVVQAVQPQVIGKVRRGRHLGGVHLVKVFQDRQHALCHLLAVKEGLRGGGAKEGGGRGGWDERGSPAAEAAASLAPAQGRAGRGGEKVQARRAAGTAAQARWRGGARGPARAPLARGGWGGPTLDRTAAQPRTWTWGAEVEAVANARTAEKREMVARGRRAPAERRA